MNPSCVTTRAERYTQAQGPLNVVYTTMSLFSIVMVAHCPLAGPHDIIRHVWTHHAIKTQIGWQASLKAGQAVLPLS
jgi:hypothetical protein